MKPIHSAQTAAVLACALGTFAAQPAHAHITMTGALLSRSGDQKQSPCDGARGDAEVYTFEPGATITLALDETIPHPGYFRIAFDDDGDDGFIEPASIKPIESTRKCPFDENDQCGESDFCNVISTDGGATVLWDNIDPHPSGQGRKSYSWNVKLPDVECDNCVIQVLQIMEDTVHGAYCPTGSCTDNSLEDIYHRCIDIKLVKGAGETAGTTTDEVSIEGVQCGVDPVVDDGAAGAGGAAAPSEEDHDAEQPSAAGRAGSTSAAGAGGSRAEETPSATPPSDEDDGGCSVAAQRGLAGLPTAVFVLLALVIGRTRRRSRRA